MIDDKMAKMAINTISKYCDQRCGCSQCAIENACRDMYRSDEDCTISGITTYYEEGYFKRCMIRHPKFDVTQKDSADFRKYISEIFLREAEKAGLPMNTAKSIKWSANGKIQVTFVDDGNKTNYIGVAKCHPDDAFNPEIGIKLAIERAAQDMRKPFIPYSGQAYYYVDTDGSVYRTCFFGSFGTIESQLKVAMGNCFKTRGQATANADIILKRLKKATELLKTLRDEGEK